MELALTIMKYLERGNWAVSIDIKDQDISTSQFIQSTRSTYTLPSGARYTSSRYSLFWVAMTPYVFARIVGAMADGICLDGVKFHHYLDDWLIVGDSYQQAKQAAEYVLKLAISLEL